MSGLRRGDDAPRRGGRNATLFAFLLFLSVSFGVLALSTRSFALNLKEVGFSLFSGVRGGVSATISFFSETAASIKKLSSLRKDYEELAARLDDYEILQRDAAGIRAENQRLREQLGLSEPLAYRHIAARVVGREPDNLFSGFIIDKGARQGIRRDMPVIAFQEGMQALVGKIVQVGRSSSLVMPIFESRSYVSARLDVSRYEGIASGQGDQDKPLVLRYVKKRAKDELSVGDLVVTSGMGGIYPPGLSLGRIARIHSRDYETSLEIELSPAVDFSRLEYVFALEEENTEGTDG